MIAACGMSVAAVAANRSVTQLEDQARQFQPKLAVCWDESAAADLKTRIADTSTRVASGRTGPVGGSRPCPRRTQCSPLWWV